jgi:hypothetical protein
MATRVRRGMDVYNADQSRYIGTVIGVTAGGRETAGAGPRETGSSEEAREGNPALVHEEQATVSPTDVKLKQQLGEEMGPVPTMRFGNTGPVNQSAGRHYATGTEGDLSEIVSLTVRPGRINLGFLTGPLWIPASAIRSISMERVVLSVRGDEIPREWREG